MTLSQDQGRLFIAAKNHAVVYVVRDTSVGLNAEPAICAKRLVQTTMVSAANPFFCAEPGRILDITGRKVMPLCPGFNDLRRLSPGVYFMREEPQAAGHGPQAVRRIVVAE